MKNNNNFMPFMLGVAWTLTGVYIFLDWEDITRTGWQVPKVMVVIFGLVSFGVLFSYLTLQVATKYPPTPHRDETKQTPDEIETTETEELIELPPLRTVYKNNTL